MGYMSEYYEDPDVFNPGRFAPDKKYSIAMHITVMPHIQKIIIGPAPLSICHLAPGLEAALENTLLW